MSDDKKVSNEEIEAHISTIDTHVNDIEAHVTEDERTAKHLKITYRTTQLVHLLS